MKKILLIISFAFIVHAAFAQELKCNVSVNGSQLTSVNKNIFRSMQMDLYEFMNNRKWTNHTYSNAEKIECSINIKLTKQVSANEYTGSITVQSKRTAYNSTYKSTVLNINDEDFRCTYQEYQQIEFTENGNEDNLTSVLAYYAYIILGFDYDSYSLNGGTEYFDKAQQIVNDCQDYSSSYQGWRAYESDYNRYWLVNNVLSSSYSGYRKCLYLYYRKGLDAMAESPDAGRAEIADALKLIQKIFRSKSRLYITQLFFDAKSSELINVFSQSYSDEQSRVVKILSECDPSNSSRYEKILDDDDDE